jgi:hypothetical protein
MINIYLLKETNRYYDGCMRMYVRARVHTHTPRDPLPLI